MKDIHEVLRQKQSKYAQLGKQIEMLQQAAEKLREVAPLLAENDDEDNSVLVEWMRARLILMPEKRAQQPREHRAPPKPGGPRHPVGHNPAGLGKGL